MGMSLCLLKVTTLGSQSPAAYLLGVSDTEGNVYLLDGFYERETGRC